MRCSSVLTGMVMVTVLLAGQSAMADPSVRPSAEPEATGPMAEEGTTRSTASGFDTTSSEPDGTRTWKFIHGNVERVKRVALHGEAERDSHLVALVNGGRGHRMIVDLGPALKYRGVPVMSGAPLAVRGPITWIDDRKVLLARRVSVGGEKIQVQRDPAMDLRQLDRRHGGEMPVTGQIEQAEELRLRGVDKHHVVVRLKTQDGKQMLADLGAPQDLTGVSLEKGRSITVKGPVIRVSDKPLILARHVTAEGKNVHIDRDVQSVAPALFPGAGPPASRDQRASGGEAISGKVIVQGELYRMDKDGFYVVRDESGQETYLIVNPDMERQGFHIGDHVTAQVEPDGKVISMEKASGQATNEAPAMSHAQDEIRTNQ